MTANVSFPDNFFKLINAQSIFIPVDRSIDGDLLYYANFSTRSNNTRYTLCGVPGVCTPGAEKNCFNVTIAQCSDCSTAALGLFAFIILCLGLAILFGNSLIWIVSLQLHKKKTAKKIDWYKASLAVADLLTGFQIFFVTFPNFAWSVNSTLKQFNTREVQLRNTGQSITGGFFYLLAYTSSLYHLLLLGVMRLYAIKCPLRYRRMSKKSVYKGIGVVWSLAAVVASLPAWFPFYFRFDYYHDTFLYLPSLIISPSSSFLPGILVLCIFLIIPYTLMTLLLILTAILVRMQVMSSKKRLGQATSGSSQDTFSKQEIATFKTVSMMQLGFTVTQVPLCVAASLIYSGYLTCDSFSTPYMVCLYLSMTNSFVNVLIYSMRDNNFRTTICDVFRNTKSMIVSKFEMHQIFGDGPKPSSSCTNLKTDTLPKTTSV